MGLLASALSRILFGASGGDPSAMTLTFAVAVFVLAARLCDHAPTLGAPVEEKPYHSFRAFWPRYLAEHREPRDRVAHVFEFFGVVLFMVLQPGRLVALALAVGVGA